MFHTLQKNSKAQQAITPDLDDEDSNSISIIDDNDVDVDVEVDVDEMPTQKPHFLDYDAVPPPEFEESFDRILSFGIGTKPRNNDNSMRAVNAVIVTRKDEPTPMMKPTSPSATTATATSSTTGEQLKLDKKYERDGEISDYELAASGYTKKEFTQDDNTLHLGNVVSSGIVANINIIGNQERTVSRKNTPFTAKPKHFLDENPIPPDYMLDDETAGLREHRSLDRNFERHNEAQNQKQQQQQQLRRTESPVSSLSGGGVGVGVVGGRRKNSFDRSTSASGSRSSRERFKEQTTHHHHHSYSLSRFLDSTDPVGIGGGCPSSSSSSRVPKTATAVAAAWTDSFAIDSTSSSRYGNLQLSSSTAVVSEEVGDSFGPKVECVYSLLSMLGSNDPLEMSNKFLELSRTPETCTTLRRSGCIPLLVQMMHSVDGEESVRKCASMALHNVVHSHPDEKAGRREAKVLRLLDQIMEYCNFLKTLLQSGGEAIADDSDRHPLAAISSLMKVSFDEEHRHAMCELGALQAIPSLVHLDHAVHGPKPEDQCCNSLRRYALMALTNLTFGDENNKALLCSQKLFMEALVGQLDSAPDDLLQVTASVLRNLSWRADSNMKSVLNEIGTVTALARAAMKNKSENTLKAILSALWNLSAHCSTNKAEFCAVDGALAFLVEMLTYEGPSKTLKIIENAGGILRNVSSHIAVREHYRQILREHNCLAILLQQLKSESLTVVSNSCGTLWNLSARCPEDQKFLWDNGAVPMLRSLIHSKHSMISEGSSSALKNLLNFRPSVQNQNQLDPIARSMGLKKLPSLNVRKQKALEQELGSKEHAETCDNLDVIPVVHQSSLGTAATSTTSLRRYPLAGGGVLCAPGVVVPTASTTTTLRLTRSAMLTKSESRDSVFSAKSDSAYENFIRSHSASDANRKTQQPQKLPFHTPRTAFALENVDVEPTEEQPIDYSVKYNSENSAKIDDSNKLIRSNGKGDAVDSSNQNVAVPYAAYQETDLDQPTDFSLRYAENQNESDVDILPPDVVSTAAASTSSLANSGKHIMHILEDSVKCYQTEDTPYVISNAASVTDLRQNKGENVASGNIKSTELASAPVRKYQKSTVTHVSHHTTAVVTATAYGSGSYTPEKPINYCEEGTPGSFSRYESLSSLEESAPAANTNDDKKNETLLAADDIKSSAENCESGTNSNNTSATINLNDDEAHVSPTHSQLEKPIADTVQMNTISTNAPNISASMMNSAQETPLMFSRHSSMDSLVEEDIGPCDDKSSVVSDFSRLASGVISPSELPDSPTQSMPQSPRRNSACGSAGGQGSIFSTKARASPVAPRSSGVGSGIRGSDVKPALQSVFEDNLNMFNVENTPAQFSTATSLSNLSILDDENISSSTPNDALQSVAVTVHNVSSNAVISEGEEEDNGLNNDDLLLASCINMGMNRASSGGASSSTKKPDSKSLNTSPSSRFGAVAAAIQQPDEPKRYYTEDTPALLSKVCSNTNLSAISICSSNNDDLKDDTVYEVSSAQRHHHASSVMNANRHSLTLSDDVSSNASECGGAGVDILQQCIRDGMKNPQSAATMDPIAMMRRGGNTLPPYLPVTDEMSKYVVEDSPCNFSVVSGLSNLTVGSSLVGPAVQLKENKTESSNLANARALENAVIPPSHEEDVRRREQQWQDDSLSSLSIDSEDDTNLLSQAIAAGCNRPKSNLGFSSSTSTNNKRSTSLSASQPIPINSATSASSLTSTATARVYQRQHHQQQHQIKHSNNGNESFSSVDSSDSNDNQSKSLFELCILTGMHKSRDTTNSRESSNRQQIFGNRGKSGVGSSSGVGGGVIRDGGVSTQSNPNLKQFDSLPMHLASSHQRQPHHPQHHSNAPPNHRHRKDDRERKDEKLLQECINTGISNKIAGAGGALAQANDNIANNQSLKSTAFPFSLNAVAMSKNGQATSVAALEPHHPTAATTFPSANSTAAAPDVEKSIDISTSTNIITNSSYENMIGNNFPSLLWLHNNITINPENTINDQSTNLMGKIAHGTGENRLQNHENAHGTVNGIGCKEHDKDDNFDSELSAVSISPEGNTATTSDDSNESFIMETTVSLENNAQQQSALFAVATPMDKHKDPDLMLKSVERLTLEFVSSAEQLRTNNTGSNASDSYDKRHGSISYGAGGSGSGGGGNSTSNTWNDNTCPNDVSFPSISVSAPMVASLKYDDDDDDDEEQATEADHRELHDFAEITPTNEEQPAQPSLSFLNESDMYAEIGTQPNSLDAETETETLINDEIQALETFKYTDGSGGSGINFQLGGEVQSAAAAVVYTGKHMFFNNAHGAAAMTNSTIIAIEARALAENLQQTNDDDDETDLTFSINSLDLDNIRPPSGMESLNISGFYQELSPSTQSSSLQRCYIPQQQSPQFSTKSPKFPRKSLLPGLVAKRALGQLPGHLSGSAESVNSSCNLLDNIKPPSLMDELLDSMISVASIQSEVADCESMATTVSVSNYETAAGCNEFDDNTVTLQSCYDLTMPHDDADEASLNGSGTPLPSDYEFSSAESTPKKSLGSGAATSPHGVKRTLTPKQKRKLAKDRFKTYTIAADIVLSEEQRRRLDDAQQDETLQIEIIETTSNQDNADVGSANRASSIEDRYKTQTILFSPHVLTATTAATKTTCVDDGDLQLCSLTSTDGDDGASDDISSIRAMTKQFKFISAPITPKMETAEPVERLAAESIFSSVECDQSSETESCHGQNHNDVIFDTEQNGGYEDEAEGEEEEEEETSITRPRIAKPDHASILHANKKAEEPKAIRGRKKPPYISPYSMQYQQQRVSAAITVQTTRISATTIAFRKRNSTTNTTAAASASKVAQKKKNNEVAGTGTVPTSAASTTPAPLERQGTFVQDEPTIKAAQVPIYGVTANAGTASGGTNQQSSPTQRMSKLPTKRPQANKTTISPKITSTTTTTATTRKIPTATTVAATSSNIKPNVGARRTAAAAAGAVTPQRSNSNATIRVTSNAARIAVLSSRVSTTTPPSRSNSILNSSNTAAAIAANAAKAKSSAAAKINQAQSRIAGIWKRVDDAKSKQQQQQKLSTTNKLTSASNSNLKTQPQTNPSSAQKQKLIRSSTFDNTPTAAAGTTAATVAQNAERLTAVTASKTKASSTAGATSKIALNGGGSSGAIKLSSGKATTATRK